MTNRSAAQGLGMVGEEGAPALAGWPSWATTSVAADGAGADGGAKFEQLAADAFGAPMRVLARHSGDQRADLGLQPRPPERMTRPPVPEQAPALAVPARHGFRLNQDTTLQAYGAVELITPDGRHHGIDIACQEGAPIFSVTAGTVFDVAQGCTNGAVDRCGGGYGNHVVVRLRGKVPGDTTDHDYYVIYAHLLTTPLVSRGERVQLGTELGLQGDSGLSWGSHLHFEVDRDQLNTLRSIDPISFLPSWIPVFIIP